MGKEAIEPVYDSKNGIWKCPICNFIAMSKRVVEQHIQKEHSFEVSENEGNSPKEVRQNDKKPKKEKGGKKPSNSGKKVSKKSFRVGKTELRFWDYTVVDIKDQRSWQLFTNRNYLASIHKRKVLVRLITGEVFEGVIKTRDPYFVTLVTSEGERFIINKGAIAYVKLLPEEGKR